MPYTLVQTQSIARGTTSNFGQSLAFPQYIILINNDYTVFDVQQWGALMLQLDNPSAFLGRPTFANIIMYNDKFFIQPATPGSQAITLMVHVNKNYKNPSASISLYKFV